MTDFKNRNSQAQSLLAVAKKKIKVLEIFSNIEKHLKTDLKLQELQSDIENDIAKVENLIKNNEVVYSFSEMDFKSTSFFNSLSNLLQPIQQKMDQLLSKFPGEDEQTKRARYEWHLVRALENSFYKLKKELLSQF